MKTSKQKSDPTQQPSLQETCDRQAERAVLNTMIHQHATALLLMDELSEEDFYYEQHRQIFTAIKTLYDKGRAVDEITVADCLRSRGQILANEAEVYLDFLSNYRFGAVSARTYIDMIKHLSAARQMIVVCEETAEELRNGDPDGELLGNMEERLLRVSQRQNLGKHTDSRGALQGAFKAMEEARLNKGAKGVPSEIMDFDRLTGGFKNRTLTIIAGRPGMGKSAFAVQCCARAAKHTQRPAAIFSYEMHNDEIMLRLLSNEALVHSRSVQDGCLTDDEQGRLADAANVLQKNSLLFVECYNMNVYEIMAKCRRLKAEHNICMVMIDYIQVVKTTKQDTYERSIAEVTENLKRMSGELELPVIALSQLNRQVERTEDRRPEMSHLLASGKIEADADLVTLLYRPGYYDPSKDKNLLELIVPKNRGGEGGTIEALWRGQFFRVDNIKKTPQMQSMRDQGYMPD